MDGNANTADKGKKEFSVKLKLDGFDDADFYNDGENSGMDVSGDGFPEANHVTFTLFFSADKMTAYIRAQDYKKGRNEDNRVNPDVIYNLLKENAVTFGIDEIGIQEYCKGKSLYKDFEVAKGVRPKPGEDGFVDYYFELEHNGGPKVNEDGSVNYKELNLMENVTPGQLLCRIMPPQEGIDGTNVLGEPVKAKAGKAAAIGCGTGTELSEDGTQILASSGGMVQINNGNVEVKEVYVVNGDVGPTTGNIRFNGAVVVKGNVLSDYSIFANGDIDIQGYVESSILTSTGNITIHNGVNGMKKGMIKADGDVTTKFAEMARIISGGSVYFDYCINCDVRAVGAIIGKGKRASLLGGTYIAGESINIQTAGSELNLTMELQIIPKWNEVRNLKIKPEDRIKEYNEKIAEIELQLADYNKRLEKLEIGLLKVSKKVPGEPKEVAEEKKKNLMLLMQGKSQMKQGINDLEIKKRRLDATMECEGCSIVVKKIIHTGVRVTIGTATLRINGHKEVQTFVEEDGVIKAFGVVV